MLIFFIVDNCLIFDSGVELFAAPAMVEMIQKLLPILVFSSSGIGLSNPLFFLEQFCPSVKTVD